MDDIGDVVKLTPAEMTAWDIYYASVAAMFMHPGNRNSQDLVYCAVLADRMLVERMRRFGCRGS